MKTFENIAKEIVELHARKNHDYGNAFADSFKEFGLTSAIIRLNDKMNRLKSLNGKEGLVKDESVKDTLMDLAAYAIMTIEQMEGGEEVDTRKNKVLTEEVLKELWGKVCGFYSNAYHLQLKENNVIEIEAFRKAVYDYLNSKIPHIERGLFNFGYKVVLDLSYNDTYE